MAQNGNREKVKERGKFSSVTLAACVFKKDQKENRTKGCEAWDGSLSRLMNSRLRKLLQCESMLQKLIWWMMKCCTKWQESFYKWSSRLLVTIRGEKYIWTETRTGKGNRGRKEGVRERNREGKRETLINGMKPWDLIRLFFRTKSFELSKKFETYQYYKYISVL